MKVPNPRYRLLAAIVTAFGCIAAAGLSARLVLASQPDSAALDPAALRPADRTLHLLVGRSSMITSELRIVRLVLADQPIVTAEVMSPTQILVSGKTPGLASLAIWDDTGQSHTFDVYVDLDLTPISAEIRQNFPHETVNVEARGGVITLSGQVSTQGVADHVLALAQAMALHKDDVVSLLQLPPPVSGEVLLEVKFADIDRSTLSQFGANFLSTSPATTVVSTTTGQFSPPTLQSGETITGSSNTALTAAVSAAGVPITVGQLLNIFIFRSDINLGVLIQALEQKNLLQILAEPNVLAETGKEASFLAGGQFPFPVVQGSTGGVPVVTIEFREYGVKLVFTPIITAEGLIHLKVAPEVSSLDYTNALTIQGFTIPSIATRSVHSEMILKDGQSFVIAGLVNNQVNEQFSKVPGLGDIPILGNFFKSRSVSKSQDELLVMVTPHIIQVGTEQKLPPLPAFPDSFLKPEPAKKNAAPGGK